MRTEKIYDENPRLLTFEAKVLSCTHTAKRGYDIILDRTAFFPEGGGQKCDRGSFLRPAGTAFPSADDSARDIPVLDVQIEGDIIHHFVSEPLPKGCTVSCQIDWAHRFDNMQQHSGEHIVSGLVNRHFGWNNVGFHLSESEVTLDFDGPLTEEQLAFIEQEANKAIYQNLEIKADYPSPKALASLNYRSKIELTGAVRIVEIPGYDVCACCAPHVACTGEIGMIKITNCMNYKGGVRLNILCGSRALADYHQKQQTMSALSALLSAKPEKIIASVQQINDDRFLLKGQMLNAQKTLLQMKIDTAPSETVSYFLFCEPLDNSAVHFGLDKMAERFYGFCGILLSDNTSATAPAAPSAGKAGSNSAQDADASSGFRFQIASAEKDCRTLLASLKKRFTVKGGGNDKAVQGHITASRKELEDFFASFIESGLCIR